jgi:hypothetical protein
MAEAEPEYTGKNNAAFAEAVLNEDPVMAPPAEPSNGASSAGPSSGASSAGPSSGASSAGPSSAGPSSAGPSSAGPLSGASSTGPSSGASSTGPSSGASQANQTRRIGRTITLSAWLRRGLRKRSLFSTDTLYNSGRENLDTDHLSPVSLHELPANIQRDDVSLFSSNIFQGTMKFKKTLYRFFYNKPKYTNDDIDNFSVNINNYMKHASGYTVGSNWGTSNITLRSSRFHPQGEQIKIPYGVLFYIKRVDSLRQMVKPAINQMRRAGQNGPTIAQFIKTRTVDPVLNTMRLDGKSHTNIREFREFTEQWPQEIGLDELFKQGNNYTRKERTYQQRYLSVKFIKFIDIVQNTIILFYTYLSKKSPELLHPANWRVLSHPFTTTVRNLYYIVGQHYRGNRLCNILNAFKNKINDIFASVAGGRPIIKQLSADGKPLSCRGVSWGICPRTGLDNLFLDTIFGPYETYASNPFTIRKRKKLCGGTRKVRASNK